MFGGKLIWIGLVLCFAAELQAAGSGVCGGRPLPSHQSRKWRNHYLACSQDTSHFLREAMLIPPDQRKEWANLAAKARAIKDPEYRQQMQAIGHSLPRIKWNGRLLYETVEHWDWTNWEYGQDAIACGTTKHCSPPDKDGHKTCYTTVNSCWHDVNYHESRHCSNETMPFDAEFYRPNPKTEWGPGVSGIEYYDELPNKYDLLPGESEDVQIYNSSGGMFDSGQTMVPQVIIGNAWNEYSPSLSPGSMACVFGGGGYHLNVVINTKGRVKKRSPNTFRGPVDRFGRSIESVQWPIDHSSPHGLWFSDASAVVISSLAQNSRAFGKDAELSKAEAEQSRKTVGSDQNEVMEANAAGFDKDTHFRLRLFKIINWQRDPRVTENMYGRGAEFANGAKSEHYKVDLSEFYHASGPWSDKLWAWMSGHVEPGSSYEFRLSMYQKNVKFYYQEEDFSALRGEDNWYSKELPIPFSVPADATDKRDPVQKINEHYQKPLLHRANPVNFVKAWWNFFTE